MDRFLRPEARLSDIQSQDYRWFRQALETEFFILELSHPNSWAKTRFLHSLLPITHSLKHA
jgi:hypothetical protein